MTSNANPNAASGTNAAPAFMAEIGPDGLPRESIAITNTEKIIEEGQLQLRKYIDENYSKIRDVERELANLAMDMKLTTGPKKAAFEHMRKKIEVSNEKIRVAKLKEEQARKVWEEALKGVKEEEEIKQQLSEDLNNLVQESSKTQLARLEELKRRLEALNPSRSSSSFAIDKNSVEQPQSNNATRDASAAIIPAQHVTGSVVDVSGGNAPVTKGNHVTGSVVDVSSGNAPVTKGDHVTDTDVEGSWKKKTLNLGRGKGVGALPKGRGPTPGSGWNGAGFDVDV